MMDKLLAAIVITNPLSVNTFEEVLNAILDFVFWIGITLAPVMLIVAGAFYVTAAGSPQQVEKAKKMIIYTIVGIFVLLLAKGLVAVLKSILGA